MMYDRGELVKILPHGPVGHLVEVVGRTCVVDCVDDDGDTSLGRKSVPFTSIEPVKGTPHHPNGPSRLKQREACPGSRWMEAGQPDQQTVDSREGTLLHEAVFNRRLREGLTSEQLELVEVCENLLKQFEVDEWMVERRIVIMDDMSNPFDPDMLLFGTADAIGRLSKDTMVIAEFKFGHVAVEPPEKNLQVAAEAVAVHQEFGCDKVIAVVIQPRVRQSGHPCYEFTDFDNLLARITGICHATDDETLELTAGDHCRYCRASRFCPQVSRTEMGLEVKSHGLITPANARQVYADASAVIRKCEALKGEVRDWVLSQTEAPGFTVINKKGARTINDPQATYDAVASLIDVKEFMQLCTVSVAQLEDAFARKAKAAGLCKTLKEAKLLFLDHVVVEYGKAKQEVRLK